MLGCRVLSVVVCGNASFGAIAAIRSQQETERFAREQFELYTRLGTVLGLKK